MTCVRCGESSIGIATDGREYCHRETCIDWKLELQRHRNIRATIGPNEVPAYLQSPQRTSASQLPS